jgi:hypothetical protein
MFDCICRGAQHCSKPWSLDHTGRHRARPLPMAALYDHSYHGFLILEKFPYSVFMGEVSQNDPNYVNGDHPLRAPDEIARASNVNRYFALQ